MKIFVHDQLHPAGFEKMKRMGIQIISDFAQIGEADGMIVRGVVADRALLMKAKNLKVVGKHGAGYNTIDVNAAKELGIRVVYAPGMNAQGVAELIVAMMLDVSRKVSSTYYSLRTGLYDDKKKNELTGCELFSKTVACLGLGNVSRRAITIMQQGFQMKILGYDNYLPQEVFDSMNVQRFTDLKSMLPLADYVNISIPLTPETLNLFDDAMLHCMKPTAILINTSRGGIVDERALYHALADNTIAGAGFDVFSVEPPSNENPLFSLSNFVGTPHLGGSTEESIFRVTDTIIDEVVAVLEGRKPRFEVF